MILVIGLGNPGTIYKAQRHNIGWQVLDAFAEKKSLSFSEKGIFSASIVSAGDLLLVKPLTFMNHSGVAVASLLRQYPDASVVVVYDDIDIALGTIKCSFARGSGGHNGVQSVMDHLGHRDFMRIRVGVRPVHDELLPRIAPPNGFEKFLLANFAPFEHEKRGEGVHKAVEVIESLSHKTRDEIMNQYN